MRNFLTALIVLTIATTSAAGPAEEGRKLIRNMSNWADADVLKVYFAGTEHPNISVYALGVLEFENVFLTAANDWSQPMGKRTIKTTKIGDADIIALAQPIRGERARSTLAWCDIRQINRRRITIIRYNSDKHFTLGGGGDLAYDFETVTAHELGHAFGVTHSKHPQDLMFPKGYINDVRRITTNDTRRAIKNLTLWLSGQRDRGEAEPDDHIHKP